MNDLEDLNPTFPWTKSIGRILPTHRKERSSEENMRSGTTRNPRKKNTRSMPRLMGKET